MASLEKFLSSAGFTTVMARSVSEMPKDSDGLDDRIPVSSTMS